MVREEALWINEVLRGLDFSEGAEVLDVGSSTRQFRTKTQAYIDELVFKPLRQRGLKITYLDAKPDDGVDLVCDITRSDCLQSNKSFDLVICCSLLEHVEDREKVCQNLKSFTKDGGFLLVSAPGSYRYHPDPIDTMFRPSLGELKNLFSDMKLVRAETVFVKGKSRYANTFKELIRYFIPFLNWKINCVLFEKVA